MGVCICSMFCCMFLYVRFSLAIILIGKRELVALLSVSYWCLVMVVWFFLAVPQVCLRFVIVIFPDHTHLLVRKVFARWTPIASALIAEEAYVLGRRFKSIYPDKTRYL